MKILKKACNWFSGLWTKLDKEVDKIVPVASGVVQAVKKAIESETFTITAEVVKKIIPGETDDVIIDKAISLSKKVIPQIASRLAIIDAIAGVEGTSEQLQAVLKAIAGEVNDEKWQKFLTGFGQEILYVLADGTITWGEAGRLLESYYQEYVKK